MYDLTQCQLGAPCEQNDHAAGMAAAEVAAAASTRLPAAAGVSPRSTKSLSDCGTSMPSSHSCSSSGARRGRWRRGGRWAEERARQTPAGLPTGKQPDSQTSSQEKPVCDYGVANPPDPTPPTCSAAPATRSSWRSWADRSVCRRRLAETTSRATARAPSHSSFTSASTALQGEEGRRRGIDSQHGREATGQ